MFEPELYEYNLAESIFFSPTVDTNIFAVSCTLEGLVNPISKFPFGIDKNGVGEYDVLLVIVVAEDPRI